MKKVIIVAGILMVVTSLVSCKKTKVYGCQCTKNGIVTFENSFKSRCLSEAKSYCSLNDKDNGTCTIK